MLRSMVCHILAASLQAKFSTSTFLQAYLPTLASLHVHRSISACSLALLIRLKTLSSRLVFPIIEMYIRRFAAARSLDCCASRCIDGMNQVFVAGVAGSRLAWTGIQALMSFRWLSDGPTAARWMVSSLSSTAREHRPNINRPLRLPYMNDSQQSWATECRDGYMDLACSIMAFWWIS